MLRILLHEKNVAEEVPNNRVNMTKYLFIKPYFPTSTYTNIFRTLLHMFQKAEAV